MSLIFSKIYAQVQPCINDCLPISFKKQIVQNDILVFGSTDNSVYAIDQNESLLWSFKSDERIYSSPAISSGRVVVGSYDKNVYCLNLFSGAKYWSFPTDSLPVYSTPIIDDNLVYIGSGAGNPTAYMYALEIEDGKLLWKYRVNGPIWSSPTVSQNTVFFSAADYNFYALDKITGQLIWKYSTFGTTFRHFNSSACFTDKNVIVGNDDGFLYAFNKLNGIIDWKYNVGIFGVYSSPTINNQNVIFGSGDSYMYSLDHTNGDLSWKTKISSGNIQNAPIAENDTIYITYDSNIFALDAITGLILWQKYIGSTILTSPVYANGNLFVGSYANQIDAQKMYKLDSKTGNIVGDYYIGNGTSAPTFYSNGTIYYSGVSGSRN